jgi:hypothetical protein
LPAEAAAAAAAGSEAPAASEGPPAAASTVCKVELEDSGDDAAAWVRVLCCIAGSEAPAASQGPLQQEEARRPHGINRIRTVHQKGEVWCTLLREPAEVHPDWVRLHNILEAILQKRKIPNTA